jgi:hypothetical protein
MKANIINAPHESLPSSLTALFRFGKGLQSGWKETSTKIAPARVMSDASMTA